MYVKNGTYVRSSFLKIEGVVIDSQKCPSPTCNEIFFTLKVRGEKIPNIVLSDWFVEASIEPEMP